MALYDEIVKETFGFEKVIGVAVKHLGIEEEASFNGDELFPTARARTHYNFFYPR